MYTQSLPVADPEYTRSAYKPATAYARSKRTQVSLLPVLGLLTNLYLMTQLGINNWLLFFGWLIIGLALYFNYGFKHSKLGLKKT